MSNEERELQYELSDLLMEEAQLESKNTPS